MSNLIHDINHLILNNLGKSPDEDILSLLKGAKKVFKSRLAIYNKFDNDYTRIITLTSDMEDPTTVSDDPEGHICTDVALKNLSKPHLIQDLKSTPYFYTDKAVKEFDLNTYLGIPVRVNNRVKGVFSVVFDTKREFTEDEVLALNNLSRIIGIEEMIKEEKEKNRVASEKYMRLVNSLNLALLTVRNNRIEEVNEAAVKLFRTTKKELMGKTPYDLSPKYQPDGNLSNKKEIMLLKAAKKNRQEFEWTFNKADNSSFLAKVTLTNLKNSGEHLFLFIIQDITKERKHELELVEAREKAEKADKLKSIFLANMSHEIRTPLNSILGFSDLLLDTDATADERKMYVEMIKTAGRSLHQLVEDIIDISKIEAGQLKINKKLVDVNETLRKIYVSAENEREIRNKTNVQLKLVQTVKGKLMLNIDEVRFHQIFNNLITNALKFTDSGRIEFGYIGISAKEIQFYVKDTGTGIPEDEIPLIFKRFGQATNSYVKNKEGKGLGLAITHSLVKLLGGKIWVDSKPGKGSTFYFTLPMDLSETFGYDQLQGPHYRNKFKDKTVLIVEDNIENFRFIQGNLAVTGANFIMAANAEEAINYCKREDEPVDIILMDIELPDMKGFEAAEIIKRTKPDLPVIAISAFDNKEDKIKSLQAGCDDYIPKPLNFNEIFGLLSRYLIG